MKIYSGLFGLWLACNLFAIASVDAALNDVCQTTDSRPGTCIFLLDCPRLYSLFSKPRPLPAATIRLLRAEQCGSVGRKPLVCCREETPVTTTTTTTPELLKRSTVEDVSPHRNVALINSDLCGQAVADRIIGGDKTALFEMPWMALLKYQSLKGTTTKESFKCGGTLINSRYVLTAAHCISNTPGLRLVSVRLGEHDTSTDEDCQDMSGTRVCAPPPQNIDVETMIRHPSYNATTLVNDIALIRLAAAADSSDTVNPICLPVGLGAQDKNLDHTKLIVAGWGTTENGSASSDLLKVRLPVMPNEMCKAVFAPFNLQVGANQLCAGGTNLTQDSCRGDSGGPLKTFGRVNGGSGMMQYGVVSYGHRHCGTEGIPGVYTRVGPYMKWILDNIQP